MRRAYPTSLTPEAVRERIINWQLDEEPGYAPVFDHLLSMLHTSCKLMRIAFEARETGFVELLEEKRKAIAAEAAFALEELERKKQAPAGA